MYYLNTYVYASYMPICLLQNSYDNNKKNNRKNRKYYQSELVTVKSVPYCPI